MKSENDTPRDAFDLLSWRTNTIIVVPLLAVALVAWIGTIDQARSMRDMAMGLGQLGYRGQGQMDVVSFLAMWMTMMAAMMLPTIVPMVLAHHAVALRRYNDTFSTPAFVAGYLVVWCAFGIAAWLVYWVSVHWSDGAAQSRWLLTLAGELLVAAGIYQFTRWKQVCADKCRSPLAFVFQHDSHRGALNALRAGIVHGAYCLGCCWAAMAVLFVVGLNSLVWMTILFVFFFVEKNWKYGREFAKVAGLGLMALGVAVLASPPAFLAAVSN